MKKLFFIFLFLLAASPFFVVDIAHAQTAGGCQNGVCTYVPLEPLPGVNQTGLNFSTYVSGMFRLFISLGALFAVLMMVLAGISYMTSSSPLDLSKARGRATKALYGLLLLVACWLILYTINPNLLRFDLFEKGVPAVANSSAQPLSNPTSPNNTNTNPAGPACGNYANGCAVNYYCSTIEIIGGRQEERCTENSNKEANQTCSGEGGRWTQGVMGQYCYLSAYKTKKDCEGSDIPGAKWEIGMWTTYCYK